MCVCVLGYLWLGLGLAVLWPACAVPGGRLSGKSSHPHVEVSLGKTQHPRLPTNAPSVCECVEESTV